MNDMTILYNIVWALRFTNGERMIHRIGQILPRFDCDGQEQDIYINIYCSKNLLLKWDQCTHQAVQYQQDKGSINSSAIYGWMWGNSLQTTGFKHDAMRQLPFIKHGWPGNSLNGGFWLGKSSSSTVNFPAPCGWHSQVLKLRRLRAFNLKSPGWWTSLEDFLGSLKSSIFGGF